MIYRFLFLIPLCLALSGCSRSYPDEIGLEDVRSSEAPFEVSADEPETVSEDYTPDVIYVYVCGEVVSPGVYELPYGSRAYEAIELAGGLTEEADAASFNQAESCHDGERIYIPAGGESPADGSYSLMDGEEDDGRININTADSSKLQEINGIGASRAGDIITYRESNGNFSRIEDIMNVPGIKQGMFDRIKDQIKV